MKLIRVTTKDEECRFDGQYNADLDISEGASMALKSLTLEQDEAIINITPGNNAITYNQGVTAYNATLDNVEYSSQTSQGLLDNITKELNGSAIYVVPGAGFNNSVQGIEYRAAINTQHRVQIEARFGLSGEMNDRWDVDDDVYNDTSGAINLWGANVALGVGQCRVIKLDDRMPNGNALLDALITEATWDPARPSTENGVWLCGTYEDISQMTAEELRKKIEDPTDRVDFCTFGVGAQVNSSTDGFGNNKVHYLSIADGSATVMKQSVGGIASADVSNPHIRLQRSGNQMYASFYDLANADDDAQLINTVPTEVTQNLWWFVVFWNQDPNIEIGQLQASLSPFSEVSKAEPMLQEYVDSQAPGDIPTEYVRPKGWSHLYMPYDPFYDPTDNYLNFQTLELANYLGFNSQRQPRSGTSRAINFITIADFRFGPRVTADSLIVLSETFDLNSYDSYHDDAEAGVGQRRSILDVVPVDRSNDGKVSYEPNTLNFIDIRNLRPEWMRNLRFRLVDGQYAPIALSGQASLVILVKE